MSQLIVAKHQNPILFIRKSKCLPLEQPPLESLETAKALKITVFLFRYQIKIRVFIYFGTFWLIWLPQL